MRMLLSFSAAFVLLAALAASPAHADLLHAYDFESGLDDLVGGVDGTLIGEGSVSGGVLELGNSSTNDGGWVEFGEKLVPTTGSYTVALFARIDEAVFPGNEFISQGASIDRGDPIGGFYLGTVALLAMRATDSWPNTGAFFPNTPGFHHVALVVDANAGPSGESRLYINGVEEAMRFSAIETTPLGLGTRLGRQFVADADEFLFGALDNVVIYDEALSPAQVGRLAAGEIPMLAAAATVPGLGWGAGLVLVSLLVASPFLGRRPRP